MESKHASIWTIHNFNLKKILKTTIMKGRIKERKSIKRIRQIRKKWSVRKRMMQKNVWQTEEKGDLNENKRRSPIG